MGLWGKRSWSGGGCGGPIRVRGPLSNGAGGFNFEEQVRPAYVADSGEPWPGECVFQAVEYVLDVGGFAVGDDLDDVGVGTVHILQHSADVFDGCIYLAFGVVDVGGVAVGVDGGGAGDEDGLGGGGGGLRGAREGRAVFQGTLLLADRGQVLDGIGGLEYGDEVHCAVGAAGGGEADAGAGGH